jgi:hypothetical protein
MYAVFECFLAFTGYLGILAFEKANDKHKHNGILALIISLKEKGYNDIIIHLVCCRLRLKNRGRIRARRDRSDP